MLKFKANRQQGFTLIELLIAMALALIIISSLASAFVSQRKTYAVQEQVSEMIQGVRATMDIICREVKMAGYAPTGYDKQFEDGTVTVQTSPLMQRTDPTPTSSRFVGIPYNTTQLRIVADINLGYGAIDATSEENIIYSYDSTNLQIDRNVGSGNQPLCENIQGFAFTYWDANETEITSSADQAKIRMIKIEIEAKTGDPDPNYTHPTYGDGYRRYKLTSYVTPPNLDF